MKITVISVGKVHDKNLKLLISDYEKRLKQHIGSLTWEIIPSSDISTEGVAILKRTRGMLVLLDETGALLTTPNLATTLESYQNSSVKHVTFVIGGAFGVSEDVMNKADFVWSLSPLVFPHQIVRLLLVEQLYRAYDILAGGKYHHR